MLIKKLYELMSSASDEDAKTIMEAVYTLENYEFLKTKMKECNCGGSLIIEGVCSKCFGKENSQKAIFVWKW